MPYWPAGYHVVPLPFPGPCSSYGTNACCAQLLTNYDVVNILSSLAADPDLRADIQASIPNVVEFLKDLVRKVRKIGIDVFSGLAACPELCGEIQTAIPNIDNCLTHSDESVHRPAIDVLSRLVAHPELCGDLRATIPNLVECLKHSDDSNRTGAIKVLSDLAANRYLSALHLLSHDCSGIASDIQAAIPNV